MASADGCSAFAALQEKDVVSLTHHGRQLVGVVRFLGETQFAPEGEIIAGVELSFPSGSCDGSHGDKRYFEPESALTKPGIFVGVRKAHDLGLVVVGRIGDGGPGDAAWADFPSTWNDRRSTGGIAGGDVDRDADAANQFVMRLVHCKFPLIEEVALSRGWCVSTNVAEDAWSLCWSDNSEVLQQGLLSTLAAGGRQKINHWPLTNNLAVKALLADKLKKMRSGEGKQFSRGAYEFFPMTWTVPKEVAALRKIAKQQQQSSTVEGSRRRTYIVKPPGAAEGRGIFLVHDLAAWLAETFPPKSKATSRANGSEGPGGVDGGGGGGGGGGSSVHTQPKKKRPVLLVQEYLDRPLLIDGLKFDLRVYVLVTSMEPLRIHVYSDGLARFCTSKYVVPTEDNISDLKMHLTNYAVNVKGENFDGDEAEDVGTKRTLQAILEWMKMNGHDADQFLRQMDSAIVKTVISIQRLSAAACRKANPQFSDARSDGVEESGNEDRCSPCFEIMGFDVFIDEDLRPWIIEVNIAPSFKTDAPLDHRIKFGVINDAFELVGIDRHKSRQSAQNAAPREGKRNHWRLALPVEDVQQQAEYEKMMKFSNVNVSRFMRFD